jgi:hypothetical protein
VPGTEPLAIFNNVPPMAAVWPFLLAAGIYLLLRWVIWTPGNRTPAATAAQHALWVGVIGWLASSLHPAANAGILPLPPQVPALGEAEIVPALAWPVLGCLAVHAIGQLSYPEPRLPRRQATLAVRRIRDFLPRALTWTVAAVFLVSAAQIAWTATLPGFAATPYGWRAAPDGRFVTHGGPGRIPGVELAVHLGGALMVLAAGTVAVLVLITRRRQLESLTAAENNTLRAVAMNRLLRTVGTVASGLAAIAGNHAARQDPAGETENWFNAAGVLNLAVLLVMWRWAPPKLGDDVPARPARPAAPQPATVLAVSIGPAMAVAALLPVGASLVIPGAITRHPALVVSLAAAAILAVVSAGELLLHRNHGVAGEPVRWPRQPASPVLLAILAAALAVLLGVGVLVAAREAGQSAHAPWPATAWTTAATTAIAFVPVVAARRRRAIPAAVPGLDSALRAITVHRVVRTLAAYFTVQAGALLLSAAPALRQGYPAGPGPWDDAWQAAPAAGVLLAAAGVVIAVTPVRGLAVPYAEKPATAMEHLT